MGKVSDALDRIDSLEEIGIVDSPPTRKQAGNPGFQNNESIIPIEKAANKAKVNGKWDDRLIESAHNNIEMAEVFSELGTAILYPPKARKSPQSIMVSSCSASEGKSFISANLGVSLAKRFDQPCILVDCDFQHPTLAHDLGIYSRNGLVDYLKDGVDLTSLTIETSVPKLFILPSGIVPDQRSTLRGSSRMRTIVENISRRYDDYTVIYDSPPFMAGNEFDALAGQVDAIILVVRQNQTKKGEVQGFIDAVGEEKIIGVVFNDLLSCS